MNKQTFMRACFSQFMTPRECELEGSFYGFRFSRREIESAFRSFELEELPADALDNWENMTYAI